MNQSEIYLDHAATTPPSSAAIDAATRAMHEIWGNPSSVHAIGLAANRIREEARAAIFSSLGVRFATEGQLIFTASGTEADNLAVFGTARAKRFSFTPKLITTDSEHPAILQPALQLEKEGWEVVRLSTKGGIINEAELDAALDTRTVLVSIMAANNELGSVYDLSSLFTLVKRKSPKTLTHTDAVQAYGKIPLHPEKMGIDLMTLSAHKIYGLKGAGALYIARDVTKHRQLSPIIFGGGQEFGMRSGTEAIPCIAAFGAAVSEQMKVGINTMNERVRILRAHLIEQLDTRIRVNQPRGAYLPSILSLTLPSVRSEVMLRYLSGMGIYVSAGSACSSHHRTASPTLLAFGLTPADADCTIRVSFSAMQTEEEIDRLNRALTEGLNSLAKIREKRNKPYDG